MDRMEIAVAAMCCVPPPENDCVSKGKDIERFTKDCFAVADAFAKFGTTVEAAAKSLKSFGKALGDAEIAYRIRKCLEEMGKYAIANEADTLVELLRKSGLEISIVGPNRPIQVK